ncbi:glycosyltransferase [Psychroserpens sp. BH13MA-6]
MSKLTIISHTEHYLTDDGQIVGLGSTVTEINHLLDIFDEIIHVAMLHKVPAPPSALPYTSDRVKLLELPALGGTKAKDKFRLVLNAPKVLKTVRKALKHTDYFQFRAPTGIGVYVIPYLIFCCSKQGWFKYAGNWKQEKAPLAYRFQRWLLKTQKRPVTINGQWPDQPTHCLTFENPCLTLKEVAEGDSIRLQKRHNLSQMNMCFVGRLEIEKGIALMIESLLQLSPEEQSRINDIHIVGDGIFREACMTMVKNSTLNFIFHGHISREVVHDIYKKCHAIILPSASEGFPKVVSEAMNYGCLPIVSNISAMAHYIKDGENGFLFFPITKAELMVKIKKMLNLSDTQYANMISTQNLEQYKFTYSYYNKRINEELIQHT